jgi:hypothetical protein
MSEGGRHFEGTSAVHEALRKITSKLDELGVPYALVGGMALFHHGVRRFTEDVDLLVTAPSLKTIHEHLEGAGYLPPFEGAKNLRDTTLGVRIEFLVTGQYPGDGKPKSIAFPDPSDVAIERDGIQVIDLPELIELKLASGMSDPGRMKDLADVVELIKTLGLPRDYAAQQLHADVRDKYGELWRSIRATTRRYVRLWRTEWLSLDASSIDEMIAALRGAADALEAMRADGVFLDPEGGAGDDYAYLVTTDPEVARKYDMHDERDFLGKDDDEA